MIRPLLIGSLPASLVLLPLIALRLLGARSAVPVITGMLPAGMGPEAFLLGFGYVFAQLTALLLVPPLLVAGGVYALPR